MRTFQKPNFEILNGADRHDASTMGHKGRFNQPSASEVAVVISGEHALKTIS